MMDKKLIFAFGLLSLIILAGCSKDNDSEKLEGTPVSTSEQVGLHPAPTNTPLPPTQTPIVLAPKYGRG